MARMYVKWSSWKIAGHKERFLVPPIPIRKLKRGRKGGAERGDAVVRGPGRGRRRPFDGLRRLGLGRLGVLPGVVGLLPERLDLGGGVELRRRAAARREGLVGRHVES